ncbi:MAG: hypothetical protein IPK13_21520 [Deltaproteobacteria bacterium]|nr:hypothetical protein [Deltaproteobacteria bacterium]
MRTMVLATLAAVVMLLGSPGEAQAHCDGLDGPVVTDARAALVAGRVDRVLKWISAESEAEVRTAFDQTVRVRALGEPARALADTYFFETLVRLHRAGEGAPYTGLKPAGSAVEPGVDAADQALQRGSVDPLADAVAGRVQAAIRQRFARVAQLRRHAERSPADGRRYVAAYVDYIHYIRALHLAVSGGEAHSH